MQNTKKFSLVALGCRTNQYEIQAYAKQLRELGFEEATGDELADICIVNTCTVTEDADRASRFQIRSLKRKNPDARIVVTGCLSDALEKQPLPEIDRVIPNKKKESLISDVFSDLNAWPEFSIDRFGGHTRAFVKVQDGCNSYCTYCIIPYVRGRSRSRKKAEIIEEIKNLIKNGYKEIVLTGINIGDFDGAPEGDEPAVRLSELVREVDSLPGLKRLRLSSIDPDEVDEELQNAILFGKTTCPSLHLVLQSGSNVVLKRMNRKYTRQIFLETAERLRSKTPEFGFTTDVIVGFPGETENDFEETLNVVEEIGFAKVHVFPYSPRKRTRAALYPDQVPQNVLTERKQRLLEIAERSAFHFRNQFIGKELTVLIEDEVSKEGGLIAGHSEHFVKVWLAKQSLRPNQIVKVVCKANNKEGLLAEVVE